MKKTAFVSMKKNMGLHFFRTVAVIFFTLLLLPFESESSSINQPLGYLYVTGELPLGWQNRELPIFDSPGGKWVGTINLAHNLRNWCLQYPRIQGVLLNEAAEDTTKIGGCFWSYTYSEKVGRYSRILVNTLPEDELWIGMDYALPEIPLMQVSLETSPLDQINKSHSKKISHSRLHYPEPRKPTVSQNRPSPALGYVSFITGQTPDDIWSYSSWNLKELPAFDAPGGERIGSFNISVGLNLCLFNPSIQGIRFRALIEESYHVAKCDLLNYYEINKGYVRVLDKSVPEGFWIPLEYALPEDPRFNLTFGTRKFLENLEKVPSFYVTNYDGYRLMDRPLPNANVLVTLDSREHAFAEFTGETNGPWAKAIFYQVSQYPEEGCFFSGHLEPYKLATYEGWIKMLNEDGTPRDIKWESVC